MFVDIKTSDGPCKPQCMEAEEHVDMQQVVLVGNHDAEHGDECINITAVSLN